MIDPKIRQALLQPDHLFSRLEVLSRPSPVPREPGLYAWYFRNPPSVVPVADCHRISGLVLLYAGISPKAPPKEGGRPSRQTLWNRVRYHMRGNAYGSTLRLTLGSLLEDSLGIQLRRVGSGSRLTFAAGENKLSEWLEANAFVTWVTHPKPWVPEPAFIRSVSLPLNIDHNREHLFYPVLKQTRAAARTTARGLPVAAAQ